MTRSPGRSLPVLLVLFFVSGAAALIYQVLWVRELGLLFGSTAQAAALAVAIFFTGIALGGWYWGRRAPRLSSSLRWFGIVEIAVAVTALGHFVLVDAYHALYPALYAAVGDMPVLDTAMKAVVAAVILLPPSFLMGGTLPLMGQHVVTHRERLAAGGSVLYAVNTAGSALGALVAGFVLPLALGFRNAYLLAVLLDLGVGTAAVLLARRAVRPVTPPQPRPAAPPRDAPPAPAAAAAEVADAAAEGVDAAIEGVDAAAKGVKAGAEVVRAGAEGVDVAGKGVKTDVEGVGESGLDGGWDVDAPTAGVRVRLPARLVWVVAFASGFTALAVEVVWTRLFAQVLQNSAYTYALVLTTFLLALSLGAMVARALVRLSRPSPEVVLGGVLVLSAVATATSPWVFHTITDGLSYLGGTRDWAGYIGAVAGVAAVTILLPGLVLGTVLPYLLRLLQAHARAPGETIGRLVAVNTTGAIAGSLAGGFVLLPVAGAWHSLLLLAAVYPALIVGLALARTGARAGARRRVVAAVALAAAFTLVVTVPGDLATVRIDVDTGDRLVALEESPAATVAVVQDADDHLALKVNNHYTLGGTRGLDAERNQTVVPMLTHDEPRSVFYLGMGTGLTAGAALAFPVEQVVVCEILPAVVSLAEQHFTPWINGLFTDERVTVHAEDGRTCLRRTDDHYDLIVSDLFTPWKAGTGNLYTLEHFETVRDRLEPGGRFVQWLPLYQVSDQELGIIARTMDEVFEQVTLWRGDLFSSRSILALVGQNDAAPLDPAVIAAQGRLLVDSGQDDDFYEAIALRMYAGNLTASGLYADRPLNTDAFPRIEYLAPRTHRLVRSGDAEFLVGKRREELYDQVLAHAPLDDDPYLAALDDRQRGYVLAGRSYSRYRWLAAEHRDDEAQPYLDDFLERSPAGASDARDVSPAGRLLSTPLDVRGSSTPSAHARMR